MYGRNIFESIDEAVEDVFRNYLSRPNVRQPILTQYCDGRRVQCPQWLRQWGKHNLGEQGYRAIEIIHAFYGVSMYINSPEEAPVYRPYPVFRFPGSSGDKENTGAVEPISDNYPLIPKLVPDGTWPADTGSRKSFPVCFRPGWTGSSEAAPGTGSRTFMLLSPVLQKVFKSEAAPI